MDKRNPESFPLVLRLPKNTVESIDAVAAACRMTRSSWIRKSIQRNLQFAITHELPVIQTPEVQAVLQS